MAAAPNRTASAAHRPNTGSPPTASSVASHPATANSAAASRAARQGNGRRSSAAAHVAHGVDRCDADRFRGWNHRRNQRKRDGDGPRNQQIRNAQRRHGRLRGHVECVYRAGGQPHGGARQQPAGRRAQRRADCRQHRRFAQKEAEHEPPRRAEGPQRADLGPPRDDRYGDGVVDEEQAHDQRDVRQRGQVEVEGRKHPLDPAGPAAPGAGHAARPAAARRSPARRRRCPPRRTVGSRPDQSSRACRTSIARPRCRAAPVGCPPPARDPRRATVPGRPSRARRRRRTA